MQGNEGKGKEGTTIEVKGTDGKQRETKGNETKSNTKIYPMQSDMEVKAMEVNSKEAERGKGHEGASSGHRGRRAVIRGARKPRPMRRRSKGTQEEF